MAVESGRKKMDTSFLLARLMKNYLPFSEIPGNPRIIETQFNDMETSAQRDILDLEYKVFSETNQTDDKTGDLSPLYRYNPVSTFFIVEQEDRYVGGIRSIPFVDTSIPTLDASEVFSIPDRIQEELHNNKGRVSDIATVFLEPGFRELYGLSYTLSLYQSARKAAYRDGKDIWAAIINDKYYSQLKDFMHLEMEDIGNKNYYWGTDTYPIRMNPLRQYAHLQSLGPPYNKLAQALVVPEYDDATR